MIDINKIHLRFLFLFLAFEWEGEDSKAFLVGSIVELSSLVFSSGNLRCCSRSYNSFFPLFAISFSVRNKEAFFLAAAARLIKRNEHKKSQKSLFAFFPGKFIMKSLWKFLIFHLFGWRKRWWEKNVDKIELMLFFCLFCAYSGFFSFANFRNRRENNRGEKFHHDWENFSPFFRQMETVELFDAVGKCKLERSSFVFIWSVVKIFERGILNKKILEERLKFNVWVIPTNKNIFQKFQNLN